MRSFHGLSFVPSYAQSVVDRVSTTDVLRLANVTPVVRGARVWFPCPVHADHNPSAVIVGERGWKCYACGAKGGILDLAVALELAPNRAAAARYLGSVTL